MLLPHADEGTGTTGTTGYPELMRSHAMQALSWLLTVPGASRTVLDARVPYATQALADVLGGSEPATYAAPETARSMAAAAYRAAVQVAPYGTPVVGISCSCALATDRPKRGEHKACRHAAAFHVYETFSHGPKRLVIQVPGL